MIRILAALLAALSLVGGIALAGGRPKAASKAPSSASVPASVDSTSMRVGVWTVHTSSVDTNFKTGDFSTPNKIVMTRVGGDVSADRADGNYKNQSETLYGNVVMHDSSGSFDGKIASAGDQSSRGPATLTADRVHIEGKVYTATGSVHYVQSDTTVDADKGTLNDDTHDLYLEGNVHIVQGARDMQASHVHYNTLTSSAHASGNVTMQFPSAIHAVLATPRPIHIRNPLIRKKPAPTPAPASP